jgi:hypothetical protein
MKDGCLLSSYGLTIPLRSGAETSGLKCEARCPDGQEIIAGSRKSHQSENSKTQWHCDCGMSQAKLRLGSQHKTSLR